jgi:hypothetical protein
LIDIIILHGSSSVGKTYMMKTVTTEDPSIAGWEVDDCKYWLDYEPTMGRSDLAFIEPPVDDAEFDEFLELYGQGPPGRRRSVAFLLSKLQEVHGGDPAARMQDRLVLATVGALPQPPDPDAPSVYGWLAERLPVSFCHVLIEIPEDRHLEQMARRGRLHLRDEILENNSRRLARRDQHDVVIADLDGLRAVLRRRGWAGAPAEDRSTIERHHDERSDA